MKTFIASTFLAIAGITGAPATQAGEIWRASGFEQPESALFDAANKRIVVSNIVGNPGKADGNGYLSLLSMDGKVIARHWVDGMDAPKGMAIARGKLYAADITKVRVVDLASGKLVSSIDVPGAVFLNDMTADTSGNVYVSDMLADTIKIPEPIIEPATSIVASVRVIALTNSGLGCVGIVDPLSDFGAATLVIQLLVIARIAIIKLPTGWFAGSW